MTWRRFDPKTEVIIQGITGKEGQRLAAWLLKSGVMVVGGVTPGKGDQMVGGLPVWNTVAEAKIARSTIAVSCIVVPPQRVRAAVEEAVHAGVDTVQVLTEQVPVHDVLAMRQVVAAHGARLLGPSSVGYLQFPQFRMGHIGGEQPFVHLHEGDLAILSNSGGMTNELLMACARNDIGIRFAMAVGGDRIVGTSLIDALQHAEASSDVRAIALFCEPGNPVARALARGDLVPKKSLAILLVGEVLDVLPRGMPYGHAGTILGEDDISVVATRAAIQARGIPCVGTVPDMMAACRSLLIT